MRRADVIGVWEKLGQAEAVEPGAIVERGRIWRPGLLRFEDFAGGQLDLETLKNACRVVFDVTRLCAISASARRGAGDRGQGPLVTDESGRP
jgi:hypothetical protein